MSEKKTVDKEDFDLTLKYNIFDILYSINSVTLAFYNQFIKHQIHDSNTN